MRALGDAMTAIVIISAAIFISGFQFNIWFAKRRFYSGKLKVTEEVLRKNLLLMRSLQKGIFVSGALLFGMTLLLRSQL